MSTRIVLRQMYGGSEEEKQNFTAYLHMLSRLFAVGGVKEFISSSVFISIKFCYSYHSKRLMKLHEGLARDKL